MSTSFVLNGKPTTLDADPRMPLLWAVREVAGLTGTKFGCGMALCGACTVHLDGKAVRSCITPLSTVEGRKVTSWPSIRTDLENAGADVVDEEVVVDGKLITSRKPDDLPAFNRELLKLFGRSRPAVMYTNGYAVFASGASASSA